MTTLEVQVGADSDDAYVKVNDTGYTDTTLLAFWDTTAANTSAVTGFRFENVTIPKGSDVQNARLLFKLGLPGFDDFRGTFYCEAHDDAPTFSAGNSPANRTLTTANSGLFTEDNIVGSGWHEIPFASFHEAIQEVVDRPGWVTGNALVVLCVPPETSSPQRVLSITAHNSTPADAAKIQVTYMPPPPSAVLHRHRILRGGLHTDPPPDALEW